MTKQKTNLEAQRRYREKMPPALQITGVSDEDREKFRQFVKKLDITNAEGFHILLEITDYIHQTGITTDVKSKKRLIQNVFEYFVSHDCKAEVIKLLEGK